MSYPDSEGFTFFFAQHHQPLIRFLIGRGTSPSEAEDAAQAVFVRVFGQWTSLRSPGAYLKTAAKRETAEIAKRQRHEFDIAPGGERGGAECSAADIYHERDVTLVRQCLTALSRRQGEVIALRYDGCSTEEIAKLLGMSPSTVRSHLRYGYQRLGQLCESGQDDLRLRRVGERVYEEWQRGKTLPVGPRPVIDWAWAQAKALRVDPKHGSPVKLIDPAEVRSRRQESPLTLAGPWALDALTELANSAGQMMVVVDSDGIVLWRNGDRGVQRRADALGFQNGACWNMCHAGANGISIALMTGRTVKVAGTEHWVQTQHDISCAAAPIRDPYDGHVTAVINFTAARPTIHEALIREIDTIAMRLNRQLQTLRHRP